MLKLTPKHSKSAAFSFVEIMLVVTVAAVLVGGATVAVQNHIDEGVDSNIREGLRQVEGAKMMWAADHQDSVDAFSNLWTDEQRKTALMPYFRSGVPIPHDNETSFSVGSLTQAPKAKRRGEEISLTESTTENGGALIAPRTLDYSDATMQASGSDAITPPPAPTSEKALLQTWSIPAGAFATSHAGDLKTFYPVPANAAVSVTSRENDYWRIWGWKTGKMSDLAKSAHQTPYTNNTSNGLDTNSHLNTKWSISLNDSGNYAAVVYGRQQFKLVMDGESPSCFLGTPPGTADNWNPWGSPVSTGEVLPSGRYLLPEETLSATATSNSDFRFVKWKGSVAGLNTEGLTISGAMGNGDRFISGSWQRMWTISFIPEEESPYTTHFQPFDVTTTTTPATLFGNTDEGVAASFRMTSWNKDVWDYYLCNSLATDQNGGKSYPNIDLGSDGKSAYSWSVNRDLVISPRFTYRPLISATIESFTNNTSCPPPLAPDFSIFHPGSYITQFPYRVSRNENLTVCDSIPGPITENLWRIIGYKSSWKGVAMTRSGSDDRVLDEAIEESGEIFYYQTEQDGQCHSEYAESAPTDDGTITICVVKLYDLHLDNAKHSNSGVYPVVACHEPYNIKAMSSPRFVEHGQTASVQTTGTTADWQFCGWFDQDTVSPMGGLPSPLIAGSKSSPMATTVPANGPMDMTAKYLWKPSLRVVAPPAGVATTTGDADKLPFTIDPSSLSVSPTTMPWSVAITNPEYRLSTKYPASASGAGPAPVTLVRDDTVKTASGTVDLVFENLDTPTGNDRTVSINLIPIVPVPIVFTEGPGISTPLSGPVGDQSVSVIEASERPIGVKLETEPFDSFDITFTIEDESENIFWANGQKSITLTFDPFNWDIPQGITVKIDENNNDNLHGTAKIQTSAPATPKKLVPGVLKIGEQDNDYTIKIACFPATLGAVVHLAGNTGINIHDNLPLWNHGTTATLTPDNSAYSATDLFQWWSGADLSGSDNPLSITVTHNIEGTAIFAINAFVYYPYRVNYGQNGFWQGFKDGTGTGNDPFTSMLRDNGGQQSVVEYVIYKGGIVADLSLSAEDIYDITETEELLEEDTEVTKPPIVTVSTVTQKTATTWAGSWSGAYSAGTVNTANWNVFRGRYKISKKKGGDGNYHTETDHYSQYAERIVTYGGSYYTEHWQSWITATPVLVKDDGKIVAFMNFIPATSSIMQAHDIPYRIIDTAVVSQSQVNSTSSYRSGVEWTGGYLTNYWTTYYKTYTPLTVSFGEKPDYLAGSENWRKSTPGDRIPAPVNMRGFDLDNTGVHQWEWVGPQEGILVLNPSGNPMMQPKGVDLFGGCSFGLKWDDGYSPLLKMDLNGDKKLTGDELTPIWVWRDKNSDAVVQEGELQSCLQIGITEINTQYKIDKKGGVHNPQGVKCDNQWLPMRDWWSLGEKKLSPENRPKEAVYIYKKEESTSAEFDNVEIEGEFRFFFNKTDEFVSCEVTPYVGGAKKCLSTNRILFPLLALEDNGETILGWEMLKDGNPILQNYFSVFGDDILIGTTVFKQPDTKDTSYTWVAKPKSDTTLDDIVEEFIKFTEPTKPKQVSK